MHFWDTQTYEGVNATQCDEQKREKRVRAETANEERAYN